MNKILAVYTELDSVYDSRRGIIQKLLVPDDGTMTTEERVYKADRMWDNLIDANYKGRRMDTFEYPTLGLDREVFLKAYEGRELADWVMFYPSDLLYKLIATVVELEGIDEKPLSIKGLNLFINTYPYDLDDALKEELITHCDQLFRGLVTTKLLYENPAECGSSYYKQFNYVFKYDLLTSKDSKKLMETIEKFPIPETTFVVPDILHKECDEFTGSISDRIFAFALTVAPSIKLIPCNHKLYDYRETTS